MLKIAAEEFEKRKNKKFPNLKTIEFVCMTKPYKFSCPIHGEQTAKNCYIFLNSKYGCPICYKENNKPEEKIPKRAKYTNEELKEKLNKKYEYTFPEYNVGSRGLIEVFCKKHNLKLTKSKEEFLEQCKNKFGNLYEYNLSEYKNGLSYITVVCKRCTDARKIIAKSFLNSKGICPICDSSEGEFRIRKILTEKNIKFKQHCYDFKDCKYKNTLEFDFYLPDYNTVIEFQGEQHYIDNGWKSGEEFKEQQIRDKIKREYCKNNNIKEIEISYKEINEIERILQVNKVEKKK
jgi:hypothetical protein